MRRRLSLNIQAGTGKEKRKKERESTFLPYDDVRRRRPPSSLPPFHSPHCRSESPARVPRRGRGLLRYFIVGAFAQFWCKQGEKGGKSSRVFLSSLPLSGGVGMRRKRGFPARRRPSSPAGGGGLLSSPAPFCCLDPASKHRWAHRGLRKKEEKAPPRCCARTFGLSRGGSPPPSPFALAVVVALPAALLKKGGEGGRHNHRLPQTGPKPV